MPDLSVVLVAPNDFGQVRKTVHHLLAQTALHRMELVLVASSRAALGDAAELDRFPAHRIVEVGPIGRRGIAAAAGVPAARSPIVAFVEEHSSPGPGWAEALLRAHEEDWAGVTPVIRNANPDSGMSRAHFYLSYLGLAEPLERGETSNLAWHNSAYKRELLVAFGDRLGELLEYEGDLIAELARQGHRFLVEPEAVTEHVNLERVVSSLRIFFHRGRIAAARRVEREGWSLRRRLAYVLGSPLIPLMYLPALRRDLRRIGQPVPALLRALPTLAAALGIMAIGEVTGFLFGEGDARARMEDFELHRARHLHGPSRASMRESGAVEASTT